MNLPCQIFLLCKVLDFVESKILVWRAEVDLVMIFFVPDLGALYRIGGSSTLPLIARVIIKQYFRRKFRNQTSDNMERWKSRGGKS